MMKFEPEEKWIGLEGMAERELEKLRGSSEVAVDRAGLHLEGAVKRILGAEGGPRTGRSYVVPASAARGPRQGTRRKNPPRHQASAPGEPPAWLFGALARSITHSAPRWDGWVVSTEVGSNVIYARRLEWGGVDRRGIRILPRPYFAPTILREEDAIDRILDSAVVS